MPSRVNETLQPGIRDEAGEWGVPPFEPLSIRTADFDELQVLDHPPMSAHAEPVAEYETLGEAAPETVAAPGPGETGIAGTRPRLPNAVETQRLVTLRVCAVDETRWSGVMLLAALNDHGLSHGRYQVFHRKHGDGRTLFCAASLVEPGTFNLEQMPIEEYRGLTLFAVLPGPMEGVQAVDALIDTAAGLARTLNAIVQDSMGQPLTPERADALREDVARFQAMLAMN